MRYPGMRCFPFLLLLLVLLVFSLTACSRKHNDDANPIAPVAEIQKSILDGPTLEMIQAATGPVDLATPPVPLLSPVDNIAQFQSVGGALRKPSASLSIKASVAPNPQGPNLALAAWPSASSYWPWPVPAHFNYLPTPDHAINGDPSDLWTSSFWSWYSWFRLDWGTPQTINRIFITHQDTRWPQTNGQTITSIQYFDLSTGSWATIPGSYLTSGGNLNPAVVDFSFDPIETTGIIVNLHTGPILPHPNYAVFINEIEVYGQEEALKITAPINGSEFQAGDPITFVGEKVGNITNIQWSSDLEGGIISSDFPTFTTSSLRPGTHTITLSGIVGGGPPVSIRNPGQASIRALAPGTPVTHSIQIGVKGNGKPGVIKIEFLPSAVNGQGEENLNQIYDRQDEFKKGGNKFLGPVHWEGDVVSGIVQQKTLPKYPFPISYVRSDAGFDNSRIKLKAYFSNVSGSSPLTFMANLTGNLSGITYSFQPKTIEIPAGSEKTETFESLEAIPDKVGIWDLTLNWSFTSGSTSLGSQRIPDSGFQTLYTTWEKPTDGGYFESDVIDAVTNRPRVENKPALYLEILRLSCNFADGANSSNDEKSITTLLLNNLWVIGGGSLGFVYKAAINPSTFARGVDAVLTPPHEGLCQDWSYFLKALNHSQGGHLWFRGASFTMAQYNSGLRLWDKTPGKTLVGLGGASQPPVWKFGNHAYNSFNLNNVVDASFQLQNPSEESHINGLFEIVDTTNGQTFPNPFPELPIFISNQ